MSDQLTIKQITERLDELKALQQEVQEGLDFLSSKLEDGLKETKKAPFIPRRVKTTSFIEAAKFLYEKSRYLAESDGQPYCMVRYDEVGVCTYELMLGKRYTNPMRELRTGEDFKLSYEDLTKDWVVYEVSEYKKYLKEGKDR